jgi:anti-sigma factor RsiW
MSHDQAVATMAAERYLLDELPEAERDAFEEHYFSCPECADDVRAGEAMRREMQDAFRVTRERTPLPFRPPARRSFKITGVLPWAVAAMLVLTVGYQSVVVIPSLRSLSEAQVLSPVVLRPAARGETPVVPLDAGARFVSLSFEANVDPGVERIHYLIRASDSGAIVADGQTAAPVSGSSVLLIVPARRLERGTQYVAELRNAVDLTALIGEYRFTIAP